MSTTAKPVRNPRANAAVSTAKKKKKKNMLLVPLLSETKMRYDPLSIHHE